MHANPTTHPETERLAGFGLGMLDDAESAALVEHLETCENCRRTIEETPSDTFIDALKTARPAAISLSPPPPELANHARFRILRELARGGMGVVYLAEHRLMERQVAIKVINK